MTYDLQKLYYDLFSIINICSRYGSDNGQGANWHPTRAFHMLRGEAIAWIFGLVMLETINEVTNELNSKSRESLRDGNNSFLQMIFYYTIVLHHTKVLTHALCYDRIRVISEGFDLRCACGP